MSEKKDDLYKLCGVKDWFGEPGKEIPVKKNANGTISINKNKPKAKIYVSRHGLGFFVNSSGKEGYGTKYYKNKEDAKSALLNWNLINATDSKEKVMNKDTIYKLCGVRDAAGYVYNSPAVIKQRLKEAKAEGKTELVKHYEEILKKSIKERESKDGALSELVESGLEWLKRQANKDSKDDDATKGMKPGKVELKNPHSKITAQDKANQARIMQDTSAVLQMTGITTNMDSVDLLICKGDTVTVPAMNNSIGYVLKYKPKHDKYYVQMTKDDRVYAFGFNELRKITGTLLPTVDSWNDVYPVIASIGERASSSIKKSEMRNLAKRELDRKGIKYTPSDLETALSRYYE